MKAFWGDAGGLRYLEIDPEDPGSELPLIVAIHGRGADATDLAALSFEIDPGCYRWVLPQGPRPVFLAPGAVGWAWYELGETQSETVLSSRALLAACLDEILERISVPRDETVLMGFSQGAVMALHVGLASPEPFAAVIAMSGHLPAADALEPLLPQRRERQVLVVHGTMDPVLPIERGRRVRDILQAAGLQLEYHEFPMGHQITPESLATVREHIHRVLPPAAARAVRRED